MDIKKYKSVKVELTNQDGYVSHVSSEDGYLVFCTKQEITQLMVHSTIGEKVVNEH